MADELALRSLLARAAGPARAEFSALISGLPYERKGILFSEMYFLWLCARGLAPRRILESGRARGQSTLILSHCFPDAQIVSIEYDRTSPDVAVAAERLRGRDNVELLFGDATQLLPQLASAGDIALIDGPKGYRGLRLALRLLHTRRLPLVFVHDTALGSEERRYLARHVPEAIYSDDAAFAAAAHALDQGAWEELPAAHRWSEHGAPAAGYGFSLACLPQQPDRDYRRLLLQAVLAGFRHRWFKA